MVAQRFTGPARGRVGAGAAPSPDAALDATTSPVITGQWLVRFRWAAVLGAACTLAIAWSVLGLRFPVAIVAGTLSVQLVSNAWLALRMRARAGAHEDTLGAIVMLDVVLLTVLMLTTGGRRTRSPSGISSTSRLPPSSCAPGGRWRSPPPAWPGTDRCS